MSYYQQSGISSGLVRRINQGMSARVKTGEEFANTRRSNKEFAGAADSARLMALTVQPKYRPMFLNFSQAKLTKDIYALVRTHTANWGQRCIEAGDTDDLCAILNKLTKKNYGEYFGTVSSAGTGTEGVTEIAINVPQTAVSALLSLGADGITFRFATFSVQTGKYDFMNDKMVAGNEVEIASSEQSEILTEGSDLSTDASLNAKFPFTVPLTLTNHEVVVVVAMPYRTINSVKYTLQELCSFYALPSVYDEE